MRRSSSAIARESAAALRTLAVQRDLRYGDAPRALIDYFPAPASAPRPGLLVYFHGGYWQELSKDGVGVSRAGLARGGVRARGRRLHAGARGAASRDRRASAAPPLAWLHARADTLGFDAGNIVVAGSSAGGVSGGRLRGRGARRRFAASCPCPASSTSRR